jgi:predicted enzyme related to lactoylglutathione lyase
MSTDVEASKAFYAKVAGWTYQDVPFGGGSDVLAFVDGNPVPVAGIMACAVDQPGANDWFAYLNVTDIDASVAAVAEAGGMVMREPFEIEGTGWIAIVMDSARTAVGLLEPVAMG